MVFTATQIALIVNGKVEGDEMATVANFAKIEEGNSGDLAFLSNPKYEEHIYSTKASIVLINKTVQLIKEVKTTLIVVDDAYAAFATLLSKYQSLKEQQLVGIQEQVYISPTAIIGENCYIAAFSYISNSVKIGDNVKLYPNVFIGENVIIGDNSILFPGVKIYHDGVIGKNVIIHAGTVIGSDGFGFAPNPDGSFSKIPQIGNVILEDYVEIGANTTIDRATMGSTIVRFGAKLDNLIQIAHNVEIGANTVIAAQVGVSGSTKIGNNVMLGGQSGVVGHITIADKSKINAQSGVTKTIKTPGTIVTGTPAYDYNTALRSQAIAKNLPSIEKRIQELETKLKELMETKRKDNE